MTLSELKISVHRLLTHLREVGDANRPTRVHAAARFISHFAGLSLKTCFQLPIRRGSNKRRGSMHLDLKCAVLRRDALCVAGRKKRSGKNRTNGRWWRLPLPPEIVEVLLEALEHCPAANTLGDLIHSVGLDYETCQHILNDGLPTSHRPEDARFACSFRTCLIDLDFHPALVARVSGDPTTTPLSDHFYLTFTTLQVHEVMVSFCKWAGLHPPIQPTQNRSIGSPKALSLEDFSLLIKSLNQLVLSERNKITSRSGIAEVVSFHNLYTKAIALQFILAHGGRGNLIGRLTNGRLFASCEFIAISDKRTDPYSKQRVLPLTEIFIELSGRYREHLEAISQRLLVHSRDQSKELENLSHAKNMHNSAFQIFTETQDGWSLRSLNRPELVELLIQLGKDIGMSFDHESLNVGRHFWHTELLRQLVSQPAIEAFLGHHTLSGEVFGYGSGVSVREVCDYLRPVITGIQKKIGFIPLVGLGRTAKRYLKLPSLAVQKNLRPLPSKLLLHKLDQQDLVVPDIVLRDQDPPSTSKTLIAHTTLQSIKNKYSKTANLSSRRLGASLFCLIAMELVLSESEQSALFKAMVGRGLWRVGEIVIAEADHIGIPIAQRVLQESTQAAVAMVRKSQIGDDGGDELFGQALADFHQLMIELEPTWPSKDPRESARLLSTLTSHWAAIEVAPGTLFGVHHKAPFIPVHDLARIYYKHPRSQQEDLTPGENTAAWTKDPRFRETDKILAKWANKDIPRGESKSRAEGCSRDLTEYLSRPDLSLAERTHAELLIADLSLNAPYKRLDASTLPSYSNKYQRFFKLVDVEDTCDLEPEHFQKAFVDMGGGKNMSESAIPRWAMLHICAFLQRRGHWVPAALTTSPATKTPRPARIPVYTTSREIGFVGRDLTEYFDGAGGSYLFSEDRLKLERSVPTRAAELRFARPLDFDLENQLFHITTSGHDHLKNSASRGTVPIGSEISAALKDLKKLRQEIGVGFDTLMFPDAHLAASYKSFDEVSRAIKAFVVERTGCLKFRRHDFRSSASTDICFSVEESVDAFASGKFEYKPAQIWTSREITERFIRFSKAARISRHASVATTLRYYNCSGPLDLYQQLRIANACIEPSGIYASEVIGLSAQTIYVLKDRKSGKEGLSNGSQKVTYANLVSQHLAKSRQQLPIPSLRGPTNQTTHRICRKHPLSSPSKLVQACLLAKTGITLKVASDALNLPLDLVEKFQDKASQFVSQHFREAESKDTGRALFSRLDPHGPSHSLGNSIDSLSNWLTSTPHSISRGGIPLRLAIGTSPSALTITDSRHLLDLLPIMEGISQNGFRVLLRVATGKILSRDPQLTRGIKDAGVELFTERGNSSGLGSIHFSLRHSYREGKVDAGIPLTKPDDISPRSLGMAGRIVVFGFVLAMLAF